MFHLQILSLFCALAAAQGSIELPPFSKCVIHMKNLHATNLTDTFLDLVNSVLEGNRNSIFVISLIPNSFSIYNVESAIDFHEECALQVILPSQGRKFDSAKVETYIETDPNSYRPDKHHTILFLTTIRADKHITFSSCAYKKISIRIFSIHLNHRDQLHVWYFYCHLCPAKWRILPKSAILENIDHSTFRNFWDPKQSFFYMLTPPVEKPKRLKGCERSPWFAPKRPCHPQYTLTDFLSTSLNVSFRHHAGPRGNVCYGILTGHILASNTSIVPVEVQSYNFKQVVSSQFRYCVGFKANGEGTLQFWAWITPYTPPVWGAILVAMVISVITITLQDKGALSTNTFIVIAIHLRQNYGTQTTLKWTLHFVMTLTLAVYETYFTSQVIVPPARDNSLGFATLVKSGYRITIPRNFTSFMAQFQHDLKRLGIQILEEKHTIRLNPGQTFQKLQYNESLKLMRAEVVLAADRRMRATLEENRNVNRKSCRFARDKFSNQETYDFVHVMMRREALRAFRITAESGFFEGFWRTIRQDLILRRKRRMTRKMMREGGHFLDISETIKWVDIIRLNNLESLFVIYGALLGVALLLFMAERLNGDTFEAMSQM
ncbi:hypothetical protein Fcan01_00149 [Folsomia candida]|uniref:Ionotropic glutamate receptor C-terminal domain-containing protein n=1 Tax=Folsomia candida TaxID=158441 RepID=A0A226F811_FOLCA|nr:hypothetical protein Fcan01_00149 [Folsomia candida]